jgi:hypothetical protein
MGPPETADPADCVVTKEPVGLVGEVMEFVMDEEGVAVGVMFDADTLGARGSVSKDRVRRQLARSKEKLAGSTGSCVDV